MLKDMNSEPKFDMPTTIPIEEVLVENSTYSRTLIKRRLLKGDGEYKLENKCAICDMIPEWQGQPLSLQIDHTNGVCNDNRFENLRMLCPNCHAQTSTFAGKNQKSKKGGIRIIFTDICADCGKDVTLGSERCGQCAPKVLGKLRKDNAGRPSKEQVEADIKELGNYCAVGRKYGVSDNAVRKWLR